MGQSLKHGCVSFDAIMAFSPVRGTVGCGKGFRALDFAASEGSSSRGRGSHGRKCPSGACGKCWVTARG